GSALRPAESREVVVGPEEAFEPVALARRRQREPLVPAHVLLTLDHQADAHAPIMTEEPTCRCTTAVRARASGRRRLALVPADERVDVQQRHGHVPAGLEANTLQQRDRLAVPHDRVAIEAQWLGGQGYFTSGHAHLAQAVGAPLLDLFIHRGERWSPQVIEF